MLGSASDPETTAEFAAADLLAELETQAQPGDDQ